MEGANIERLKKALEEKDKHLAQAHRDLSKWMRLHDKEAQARINAEGLCRILRQKLKDHYNVDPFLDSGIESLLNK